MSPRAAARLETLGFDKVYDYVSGKSDWIAAGLPTVGQSVGLPAAGNTLRVGDNIGHAGERLGDVARRARAEGKDEVRRRGTELKQVERRLAEVEADFAKNLALLKRDVLDEEEFRKANERLDPGRPVVVY